MKTIVAITLLLAIFCLKAYADEEIKIDKRWYGTFYSIGEYETGWTKHRKEHAQVKKAIEQYPESKKHFKTSKYLHIAAVSALFLPIFIDNDDDNYTTNQDDDSFDMDTFLISFVIYSGFISAAGYHMEKAVDTYNQKARMNVGFNGEVPTLGFRFNF